MIVLIVVINIGNIPVVTPGVVTAVVGAMGVVVVTSAVNKISISLYFCLFASQFKNLVYFITFVAVANKMYLN